MGEGRDIGIVLCYLWCVFFDSCGEEERFVERITGFIQDIIESIISRGMVQNLFSVL